MFPDGGIPIEHLSMVVAFIRDLHLLYPSYTQEELVPVMYGAVDSRTNYDLLVLVVKFTFDYLQKVEELQA